MDDFSNPCSKVLQRAYLENWKCSRGRGKNYRGNSNLQFCTYSSALGAMNIHLDHFKCQDEVEDDYEPITLQEANQIFVSRNTVSKLHVLNNFDDILSGCFVRIPEYPDEEEDEESVPGIYRIAQISGVETTVQPYYCGAISFFKTLRIDFIGYERSHFPITSISNSGFFQHEFDEYAKALEAAGKRLPSKKTVLSKAKELSSFLVAMLRTRVREEPRRSSCDCDDSRTDESSGRFEVSVTTDDLGSSDHTRSPTPMCRFDSMSESSFTAVSPHLESAYHRPCDLSVRPVDDAICSIHGNDVQDNDWEEEGNLPFIMSPSYEYQEEVDTPTRHDSEISRPSKKVPDWDLSDILTPKQLMESRKGKRSVRKCSKSFEQTRRMPFRSVKVPQPVSARKIRLKTSHTDTDDPYTSLTGSVPWVRRSGRPVRILPSAKFSAGTIKAMDELVVEVRNGD